MPRSATLIAILLLFGFAPVAAAQTVPPPSRSAPIGHQQPRAADLPPAVSHQEGTISPKAEEIDKKLNICRGC